MADVSDLDRFEKFVDKSGDCWLWTGSRMGEWHGQFRFRGRAFLAHRAAWTLYVGEIPEGLLVCHKCDVPNCVNPDHLFIGTHKDNMQDMIRKGRAYWPGCNNQPLGERNGQSKLTDDAVREIRASKETHSVLAKKYGVSGSLISMVQTRRIWKHVT